MTFTTHAVIGAGVARLIGDPFLGFAAALVLHYASDTIPHWNYAPKSLDENKNDKLASRMSFDWRFIVDLGVTGIDLLLGLVLSYFLFFGPGFSGWPLLLAGVAGGVLPDLLQVGYYWFKKEPFVSIQRFHIFMHAKTDILDPVRGILFQAVLLGVCVVILKYFLP